MTQKYLVNSLIFPSLKVMGFYRNGVEVKQYKIPLKGSEIFDTRNLNQIFDIILIAKT